MRQVIGWQRHAQQRDFGKCFDQCLRMGLPGLGPLRQTLELQTSDRTLELGEAEVGAEVLMQPPEAGRVILGMHCSPGLAVILERPHPIPEVVATGRDHASFACCRDDLVLTEAPGRHVAKAANRAAFNQGAMGLGTILDHREAVAAGQVADGGHICRPAS